MGDIDREMRGRERGEIMRERGRQRETEGDRERERERIAWKRKTQIRSDDLSLGLSNRSTGSAPRNCNPFLRERQRALCTGWKKRALQLGQEHKQKRSCS